MHGHHNNNIMNTIINNLIIIMPHTPIIVAIFVGVDKINCLLKSAKGELRRLNYVRIKVKKSTQLYHMIVHQILNLNVSLASC